MAAEGGRSSSGNPSAIHGAVATPRPTTRAKAGRGVPTAPRHRVLKRVVAYFQFRREKEISIEDERFRFGPEKSIRLFYSYRHTPQIVRALLHDYGIKVVNEWIAKSEEEGVFLCKREQSTE
jgi:hypothetical protein